MLRFIRPLEPALVDQPPAGPGWIHEIKQDGYRTELVVEDAKCRAYTRRGNDWTEDYRPIVEAAEAPPCRSAIIDGEIIVQDERGASDFAALRSAIKWSPEWLVYFAFDLLHVDGEDLRGRPIEERRARLGKLLATADQRIAFSEGFEGEGA